MGAFVRGSVSGSAQDGWTVTKDGATFPVRIAQSAEAWTVDILREVAPGRVAGAYLRIIPRVTGGSVVVMTLPVPPGTEAARIAEILKAELANLVALADGG